MTRWLTEEEQASWRAYLHGARILEVALDADLSKLGLSLSEYELISMLSEAQGCRMRMSALADLVVQSRSRVTHTAARLEKRGLVTREPTPEDRRGVELVLTAKGREMLDRASASHLESVREHFIDLLTPEQFTQLGEAMAIVQAHGRARQ
ncbi:MAG: MarR family transcriptional regulator [Actinomycetia bacterium]|nr:MarR family transcriptional regulator [Actinomycetes bacterium]